MKFIKGHKHSEETKRKISLALMGKLIGNTNGFKKGQIPWNKDKKYSSKHRGRPLSEAHKQALRVPHEGNGGKWERTEEYRERSRRAMEDFYKNGGITGFRKKHYIMKGEDNPNWKGGVTPKHEIIRKSLEYKLWREAVFKRDSYTCVWCGQKGRKLNADHIKPFSLFPELRFELSNGRTLCKGCHLKTNTYGRKALKYEIQNK